MKLLERYWRLSYTIVKHFTSIFIIKIVPVRISSCSTVFVLESIRHNMAQTDATILPDKNNKDHDIFQ